MKWTSFHITDRVPNTGRGYQVHFDTPPCLIFSSHAHAKLNLRGTTLQCPTYWGYSPLIELAVLAAFLLFSRYCTFAAALVAALVAAKSVAGDSPSSFAAANLLLLLLRALVAAPVAAFPASASAAFLLRLLRFFCFCFLSASAASAFFLYLMILPLFGVPFANALSCSITALL